MWASFGVGSVRSFDDALKLIGTCYLFSLGSWKKIILGIHPKTIIIPAPFHSKAFVILYKFEMSCGKLAG